jgi:hypothetical protein
MDISDLLKPILRVLYDRSCINIRGQIVMVEPPIAWRSTRFSNGNIIITTAEAAMEVTNTRRRPKHLTTRGKTANWKIPSMHPNTDKHKPIDAGLKSSPPNLTGVDHMSGMSDKNATLRSIIIA